jgi:hypothetical protein
MTWIEFILHAKVYHMGQGPNIAHYDEPSKAIQNPKWNGFFFESFKRCELSKNKVQWLDLASFL